MLKLGEVDQRRQQLLDIYRTIDCPITMILTTHTAGGNDAHADYMNRVWREGAERPKEANPAITTHRVDGTHKLPFSHPAEIARPIDHLARQSPQRE